MYATTYLLYECYVKTYNVLCIRNMKLISLGIGVERSKSTHRFFKNM